MRQLAVNYKKGYYDQRNEWAAQLSAIAYDRLTESEMIYDPDYDKIKKQKFHNSKTSASCAD